MSEIVSYGVIGCGMMGQEHLRNIALLPGARVGAIFDPDPAMIARAQAIAPGAQVCASLRRLLAAPGIDCLLVASPNHLHVAQLAEIAALRPLPLMIEKPLLTDPADAARVREIARGYRAPIWVAMEYRYMPPIQALLAQAGEATGGPVMLSIREHRFPFLDKVGHWNRFNRFTGGTLVEKCCHFFDLMRLILGAEPVRIQASAGQAVNHKGERYAGETPDVWDHGYALCDFEGGARAMLELCMFAEGSRYQEEIAAMGPEGKIECLVPGPTRFWPPDLGAPPVPRLVVSPRRPKGPRALDIPVDPAILEAGDHNGSTYYQHVRFNAVVRGVAGARVEVGVEDGIRAVEMGMAAQRSALSGEAVRLDVPRAIAS